MDLQIQGDDFKGFDFFAIFLFSKDEPYPFADLIVGYRTAFLEQRASLILQKSRDY